MKKLILILAFFINCIFIPAQIYTIESIFKEVCSYDSVNKIWGEWSKPVAVLMSIEVNIQELSIILKTKIEEKYLLVDIIDEEEDEVGTFVAIDNKNNDIVIMIDGESTPFYRIGIIYLFNKIYRYSGILKKPVVIDNIV